MGSITVTALESVTGIVEIVLPGPQGPVGDIHPSMPGLVQQATDAAASATASALSADTSEANASASATSALASKDAAAVSETTATTKASEASTSATNAAASATTASTKASEASTSATDAAASAAAAATSATDTANALVGERSAVATLTNKTITSPVIDSGTANGVAYLNGSKVLTAGSGLTYNGSALQINAESYPSLKLGNAAGVSKGELYFGVGGDDLNLVSYVAGPIVFKPNNAEQMRLTSTGLGIGTSSPLSKLHVEGGSILVWQSAANVSSQNTLLSGCGYRLSSALYGNVSIRSTYDNVTNRAGLEFYVASGGQNTSEAMRIDSSGNLGIGTSSPAYKLDVLGNARIQSTNYADAVLRIAQGPATTGNTSQILFQDQGDNTTASISAFGTAFGSGLNGAFRIGTVGGSAILDASGNLGLGVVPSAWSTLNAIDVSSWASFAGFTNQAGVLGNTYFDGSNYRYKITAVATRYEQNSLGTHSWYTAPSGAAGTAISFTQAMTLDASGRLSIGTAGAVQDVGLNVFAPTAVFGNGGGGTGPRAGFISSASSVSLILDQSVTASGDGLAAGVDYLVITRDTSGNAHIGNSSTTGLLTLGAGAGGAAVMTVRPSGVVSMTGAFSSMRTIKCVTSYGNVNVATYGHKIKTSIPKGDDGFYTISLRGYDYRAQIPIDLSLSFYNYGIGGLIQYSATSKSAWTPTITLGYEDDKVVIHFGLQMSDGYYVHFDVDAVTYASPIDRFVGWTCVDEAFTGTGGVVVAYRNRAGTMIVDTQLLVGGTASSAKVGVSSGDQPAFRGDTSTSNESLILTGNNSNFQVVHDLSNAVTLYNSGGGIRNKFHGGNGNWIVHDASVGLDRMTLDSSGNLGIGVVPSAWSGPVKAIQINRGSLSTTSDGVVMVANNIYTVAGVADYYIESTTASRYYQSSGAHFWETAPSGTAGQPISFTQAMDLVNSAGASTLTVNSAINTASAVRLTTTGGVTAGMFLARPTADHSLGFQTGGTERARIDTNGNLLVGKTAQSSGGKLEVAGNVVCQPSTSAPTLAVNGEMSFQLVSDTSLKILVRGSDGITRSTTLTLT